MIFVAGYFARDHFVVTDPENDISFLETPREFGLRLKREHEAAAAAGDRAGKVLPRTIALLTDNDPVPPWAASLVAQSLGNLEVITVSLPATMFLDDNMRAGIPETRVALVPKSGDTGTPEWTRTGSEGLSTRLTAPISPTASQDRPRLGWQSVPVPGSPPMVLAELCPARPQDLTHVRHSLQAGTGLTLDGPAPRFTITDTSVFAVPFPLGVDLAGDISRDWSAAIESLRVDSVELLEINAHYNPATPARTDSRTGEYPLTAWPMLVADRRELPFKASEDPLYVFVNYYGGYFLLNARSGTNKSNVVHAESPQDFGRRIRAEVLRAGQDRGQAPASNRPVVLLAKHRPVPPHVAAAVARNLPDFCHLYTASMPVTAYPRSAGSGTATATLAFIRLPGQAHEPFWTVSTPLGRSARIDTPAVKRYATGISGTHALDQPSGTVPEQAVGSAAEQLANPIPGSTPDVISSSEPGVQLSARSDAPAPDEFGEPAVPESVRNWGSALDGIIGLVHLDTYSASHHHRPAPRAH